jgi:hypothetical protein
MTVHLIAKMAPTTETNATNTQSNINPQNSANQNSTNNNSNIPNPNIPQQNQSNPQQNQNNPNPFSNIFQMVLGGSQPATMSFNNINDLNSSLSGILGGFGIPMRTNQSGMNPNLNRTPTNSNAQQSQNNRNPPAVNSFETPVNEARRQANQNNNQNNNHSTNN